MDEDGNEPVKPPVELVAVDGQLAIIVSTTSLTFRQLCIIDDDSQAGGDTSATTLSHLWYFLLTNPACLRRLRKEVDDAFPPGEDSTRDFAKQGSMPYLNACMLSDLILLPISTN